MIPPTGAWNVDDPEPEGPATLRDGQPVWIRPVAPSDREAVEEFVGHVSDESIEARYFLPLPRDRVVEELLEGTHRAGPERLSLVVFAHPPDGRRLVAHAEYAVEGGDPLLAEVAFLIRDDFQGRGLATLLLHRLAAVARGHGIRRFFALVQTTNDPMLEVFRNCGFPIAEAPLGESTRIDIPIVEPPSWFPDGDPAHPPVGVVDHAGG